MQYGSALAGAEACSHDSRMISLMGEGNAGADGAAPVGKGVGGSAGSGNKHDRAPSAEKEIEKEEDDLDGDMDFINDIQDEIAHEFFCVTR